MKYYFISFAERRIGLQNWSFYNAVINIHPLKWQSERNNETHKELVLISWNSITAEEYDEYEGKW